MLHQHLLIVGDLVDDKRHALVPLRDNHHGEVGRRRRRLLGGQLQCRRQTRKRDRATLQRDRFPAANGPHLRGRHARHALDRRHRQNKGTPVGAHDQAAEGSQRDRNNQSENRAPPELRLDQHAAAKLLDLFPHDREAQAAAGDIGHDGARRHIGLEDQRDGTRLVEGGHGLRGHETPTDRRRTHASDVDAGAVIRQRDLHLGAVDGAYGDANAGRGGLPGTHALGGRLDAVIGGIAHEVDQRIAELVEHTLVHLHLAPLDDKVDFLALLATDLARHEWQGVGDGGDRQHQQLLGAVQHLIDKLVGRTSLPAGGQLGGGQP